MCKPGKSFNTGVKVIFRQMKVPCKSSRAGGAPPRTAALIGPAACGRCPKTDSLKRRASVRAFLKLSWISELSGTPRSYAFRFRNCALQRAPVRWTLALEPTIWRSLRPCQSRNITEQRIQRLQSRGELSRWRHAAEFPRRSTNWPRDTRNKELNSRGKRSQNIHPA